jgi:hypothetical protein
MADMVEGMADMVEGMAGTVEGIMAEGITAADMATTEEGITGDTGVGMLGITGMHALTRSMQHIIAKLTTEVLTIIGMDATPSAIMPPGTIGNKIGTSGAGAGLISGAMC